MDRAAYSQIFTNRSKQRKSVVGGWPVFVTLCLLAAAAPAQTPVHSAELPALLLSDIHLDPYHDPAKVAKLNAAPAADWPSIFAAPDSPTLAADSAALQTACPIRGSDTTDTLWRSSLKAFHTHAASARFALVSGDLLAHGFDCKYHALLPKATHADFVAFAAKTVQYVVSSLRQALPAVPIYFAFGNNDSGCGDYQLSASGDNFLAATAPILAEALPADLSQSDRDGFLRSFTSNGSYNLPLAGLPNTRIIVLDDVFLSTSYKTCSNNPDPAPGAQQLAWLQAQIDSARQNHQHIWFVSHIPPGIDLYATAHRLLTLCAGSKPVNYLASDRLAEILSENSDVVRLAIFGHTHSDEMRLITSEPPTRSSIEPAADGRAPKEPSGVPAKIVASIDPINGNRPTFTVAKVNLATATMTDYTVYIGSSPTGKDTTWTPEYTYSTEYHKRAFDSAAIASLIAGFQRDATTETPASQAYVREYLPGKISIVMQLAWPQYACSLNRASTKSFESCICAATK